MYKQIQNNTLMQAITIEDKEVADFPEVMQFLGFNLENKVWHHAAGIIISSKLSWFSIKTCYII